MTNNGGVGALATHRQMRRWMGHPSCGCAGGWENKQRQGRNTGILSQNRLRMTDGLLGPSSCVMGERVTPRSTRGVAARRAWGTRKEQRRNTGVRSEEHTSELQSLRHLV